MFQHCGPFGSQCKMPVDSLNLEDKNNGYFSVFAVEGNSLLTEELVVVSSRDHHH